MLMHMLLCRRSAFIVCRAHLSSRVVRNRSCCCCCCVLVLILDRCFGLLTASFSCGRYTHLCTCTHTLVSSNTLGASDSDMAGFNKPEGLSVVSSYPSTHVCVWSQTVMAVTKRISVSIPSRSRRSYRICVGCYLW